MSKLITLSFLFSTLLLFGCSKEKALIEVVEKGHIHKIQSIIQKGADINAQTKKGTPLTVACKSGNPNVVSYLLEAGADVNLRDNISGKTPLLIASIKGYPKIVETLLKNGANPEIQDNLSYTPLIWASWVGNIETVRLLIQSGANLDTKGFLGDNALFKAIEAENIETIELLLNTGANPNIEIPHVLANSYPEHPPYTPLGKAIDTGNYTSVRLLLDHGANAQTIKNNYAYDAVESSNPNILLALIKSNVDVNIPENTSVFSSYPIHEAVSNQNTEMVKILITAKANLNVLNFMEETPLSQAIQSRNIEITKLLLDNGADIDLGKTFYSIDENGEIAHLIKNAKKKKMNKILEKDLSKVF